MIKLFHAYSIEPMIAPRSLAANAGFIGELRWDWWAARDTPIDPYVWLIQNYDILPEDPVEHVTPMSDGQLARVMRGGRQWAEQAVNEAFTRPEVRQLARYLRKRHRLALRTEALSLPIDGKRYAYGHAFPYAVLVGGCDSVYHLSHEEGYDLPFEVWGVYYLTLLRRDLSDTLVEVPKEPHAEGTQWQA